MYSDVLLFEARSLWTRHVLIRHWARGPYESWGPENFFLPLPPLDGPAEEIQFDVDLVENQSSESDEADATSTPIEKHPEKGITDLNMEITATEENIRRSERSTKWKPPERLVEVMNKQLH